MVHAPSHDPPVTKATEPASDQSQSRRHSAGDLIFLCSSILLLSSRGYSGRASASRDKIKNICNEINASDCDCGRFGSLGSVSMTAKPEGLTPLTMVAWILSFFWGGGKIEKN